MGCKVQISEIAKVKGGKRLPKGVHLQSKQNAHPYIRVRDFNCRTLELNDAFEYVDDETQKSICQYIVSTGDVLVTIVGTIGLTAIVGQSLNGANLTENCVKISGLDSVDSEYLYYYLSSPFGQQEIARRTVGAVQPKLPIKNIRSMEIDYPTREERERIVALLSLLDDKVEFNNRINDYLIELATALFEHALDKSHTEVSLGDIVDLEDSKRIPLNSRDRVQRKGPYPYYGATAIMDYVDDYLFDGIRILLGEDGTVISDDGKPILQYVWGKYWVNNHAHILKASSIYSLEAIYVALSRTAIKHIVTGAVQMKISQRNLKNLRLTMPSPDEISNLNDLFEMYRQNVEENKALEALRDSILPKLMSGEIDVSQVEVPTQPNNHFQEDE